MRKIKGDFLNQKGDWDIHAVNQCVDVSLCFHGLLSIEEAELKRIEKSLLYSLQEVYSVMALHKTHRDMEKIGNIDHTDYTCINCGGNGFFWRKMENGIDLQECIKCNGKGKIFPQYDRSVENGK